MNAINMHTFTKMHSLGNDFMVINALEHPFALTTEQIRSLGSRTDGIGFDQLLVIEPSVEADFTYRIFNADGGEVAQCGNGARCLSKYIHDRKLHTHPVCSLKTLNSILSTHYHDDDNIDVTMPPPLFSAASVGLTSHTTAPYTLMIEEHAITFSIAHVGNPHAIVWVEKKTPAFEKIAPKLSTHPAFKEGINVSFVEIASSTQAHVRVFERGAGETMACGSAASAVMAAGRMEQRFDTTLSLTFLGGTLKTTWSGDLSDPLILSGNARESFQGTFSLRDFT